MRCWHLVMILFSSSLLFTGTSAFDSGYNWDLTRNAMHTLGYSNDGMIMAAAQTLNVQVFSSLPHWNRRCDEGRPFESLLNPNRHGAGMQDDSNSGARTAKSRCGSSSSVPTPSPASRFFFHPLLLSDTPVLATTRFQYQNSAPHGSRTSRPSCLVFHGSI